MTINYTTLLGLAKPVTGTETGQWGDVVNDQITTLLEDALANSSSISVTAGNVTLTTTTGSANQARMSTLIITGTPGTTRNVIAPSQAKIYVVINQSDAAVVVKGSATTGVTIGAGQTAQIAWNGSDFVEIGNYVHGNFVVNGNLTVNGNTTLGDAAGDTITVNGATTFANVNPTLSAGTANGVGYLNGSKVLTTGSALTFDGTTLTANALSVTNGVTLSAGTANGVLYLNGSKVATSGSALTFDGTTFATTARTSSANGAWVGSGAVMGWGAAGTFSNYIVGDTTSNYLLFQVNSAEGMRLTSTGLGIGTSSPSYRLDVQAPIGEVFVKSTTGTNYAAININNTGGNFYAGINSSGSAFLTAAYAAVLWHTGNYPMTFATNNSEKMRLDASGNLGLGVTPSAWYSGAKAFQFGGNAALLNNNFNSTIFVHNAFYDTVWRYILTGQQASYYNQINGAHAWYTAPVGTAGNAITFTQAMTLDASGNLGIGTSSPTYKLEVAGATSSVIQIKAGTTTDDSILAFGDSAANVVGRINYAHSVDAMLFYTNSAERMRLDSSGNLGLGVTPSAWDANNQNIEGPYGALALGTSLGTALTANAYYGSGAWRYKVSSPARVMLMDSISFKFYNAPTGTAGNPITFTQAMTLDANGNLGIGTSSPGYMLEIRKDVQATTSLDATVIKLYNALDGGMGIEFSNSVNGKAKLSFGVESSGPGTDDTYIGFSTCLNGGALTERARITSGGSFQIGSATLSEPRLYVYDNDTTDAAIIARQDGSAPIQIWQGSSAVERARITSGGNLCVGATTDNFNGQGLPLVVGSGSGSTGMTVYSGTTGYGTIQFADGTGTGADSYRGVISYKHGDEFMYFSTNATERARITSGGEFILGNTSNASYSAGVRFYAEATSLAGAFKSTVASSGTLGVWNTATSGDNIFINFYEGSTGVVVGSISYNRAGGLTSYNTSSDYRAKDIIGPVQNPGATIDALKVYEGKMKGATQSRPMLVAHEAQAVAPYSVTGEKDAVNDKGEPVYQQMDVSSLVPLLLAEIQSLRARVAQLESK